MQVTFGMCMSDGRVSESLIDKRLIKVVDSFVRVLYPNVCLSACM